MLRIPDCSLILWPVSFQSSSICQTDYFELPFGLFLMCCQCSSAWLRPGGFMPGDSHRTIGKPLALSFWEDSAVLEQMAAWIPTVSACVPPALLPTQLHLGCSHRPALLRGPCTLAIQGPRPLCPWGFHLAENLIFRFKLSPVPQKHQRAVPTHFLLKPPVCGQWEGASQASTSVAFGA